MSDIKQIAAKILVDEAEQRAREQAAESLPTDVSVLAIAADVLFHGRPIEPESVTIITEYMDGLGSKPTFVGSGIVAWRAITRDDLYDLEGLDDCRHGDVTTLEYTLDDYVETVGDLLAKWEEVVG